MIQYLYELRPSRRVVEIRCRVLKRNSSRSAKRHVQDSREEFRFEMSILRGFVEQEMTRMTRHIFLRLSEEKDLRRVLRLRLGLLERPIARCCRVDSSETEFDMLVSLPSRYVRGSLTQRIFDYLLLPFGGLNDRILRLALAHCRDRHLRRRTNDILRRGF